MHGKKHRKKKSGSKSTRRGYHYEKADFSNVVEKNTKVFNYLKRMGFDNKRVTTLCTILQDATKEQIDRYLYNCALPYKDIAVLPKEMDVIVRYRRVKLVTIDLTEHENDRYLVLEYKLPNTRIRHAFDMVENKIICGINLSDFKSNGEQVYHKVFTSKNKIRHDLNFGGDELDCEVCKKILSDRKPFGYSHLNDVHNNGYYFNNEW